MNIDPFQTEEYYALYEFKAPHLLSASDCESLTIQDLLKKSSCTSDQLLELRLGYAESQGNPHLRQAISSLYSGSTKNDIVVLGAPVEGIYLTMQTLLNQEDHVVALMPAYDSLLNVAHYVTKNTTKWPLLKEKDQWKLDLDGLSQAVNQKTKLIVVNFPHNPTGFYPLREEVDEIIEIAKKNDCWIFSDEMYRFLEFDRKRLPSFSELYEKSICLGGLSKSFGLPGLRMGWLVIRDQSIRSKLINWKHYTTICSSPVSEFLAEAAIRSKNQIVKQNRAIIKKNLESAKNFFQRNNSFFSWIPPLAGSVALVEIKVPSATKYCHQLAKEHGVVLLPSTCMGYDDQHVRFGFGRKGFHNDLAHYESILSQL